MKFRMVATLWVRETYEIEIEREAESAQDAALAGNWEAMGLCRATIRPLLDGAHVMNRFLGETVTVAALTAPEPVEADDLDEAPGDDPRGEQG